MGTGIREAESTGYGYSQKEGHEEIDGQWVVKVSAGAEGLVPHNESGFGGRYYKILFFIVI